MALTLPQVRLHTDSSPYHYTEDNKPLEDLRDRDAILAAAIDDASENTQNVVATGNWVTLQGSINMVVDLGKPFAYRVRIWAIQDQAVGSPHVACFTEDILMGYNALPGVVNIQNRDTNYKHDFGAATLTVTYTPSANNLNVSFSGFTGSNGYVLIKAERFGI